jgi:hypothetical protein
VNFDVRSSGDNGTFPLFNRQVLCQVGFHAHSFLELLIDTLVLLDTSTVGMKIESSS